MGFGSGTGAVYKRTGTNLGRAAHYLFDEADTDEVELAVELGVAEPREMVNKSLVI